MKTRRILTMLLLLCLLLTACGQTGGSETKNPHPETDAPTETQATDKNSVTEETGGETATNPATESAGETSSVPDETGYPVFDFEKKTVTLNSGHEMPILGLGMFSLSDSEAENSTYWALKAGFRLIDTARIYGNEAAVGRGLQRAIDEGIVTREEVFITTKMWTSDFSNGDAAIDASLDRLGVDYIDLMILHHSQPSNDVDAYQAMERAVADGKLKSIVIEHHNVLPPWEDLSDYFRGGKNSLFSVIQGGKWLLLWLFLNRPSKNLGKTRVFELFDSVLQNRHSPVQIWSSPPRISNQKVVGNPSFSPFQSEKWLLFASFLPRCRITTQTKSPAFAPQKSREVPQNTQCHYLNDIGLRSGRFFVCKGFQKGSRLNCINFFVIINIYAHASREAKRTSARLLDKVVGE